MRWLLAAGLSVVPVRAFADRVLVVGSEAESIVDVLRLELDPVGIEVVTDAVPPAHVPLDEPARFETLQTKLDDEGGLGVAEVVPTSPTSARVLYVRAADGATRSREVSISTPMSEPELRAIALVLRTMIVAPSEPEPAVPPVAAPRSNVESRPRSSARALEPRENESARASVLAGWNAWTRVDGDFVWHGPAVSGAYVVVPGVAIEVRAALSLPSSTSTPLARAESEDLVGGLFVMMALDDWLSLGAGIDVHGLSSVVSGDGDRVTRRTVVAAPMSCLLAHAELGAVTGASFLRFGFAVDDTTYEVGGNAALDEGTWALEAGLALGPRF